MSDPHRANWDQRHRDQPVGNAEPFLLEMLPRLPHGLALDIAAGRGRNALALARAGNRVVAVDFSLEATRSLLVNARAERLPLWPVAANLDNFSLKPGSFDIIVNINFLERAIFPAMLRALKPGGKLLVDTFLTDQAAIGHPRDPRFLLQHDELRALVSGLQIEEHREGPVDYPKRARAFRASVLARRIT
jgi:tellurite methyltransferase